MLLAGGGYGKIFTGVSYTYTDHSKYALAFHKLSSLCNNLVWVDGYVYNGASARINIPSTMFPYKYNYDDTMYSIYVMNASSYIKVRTDGVVVVQSNSTCRVGFFYTGRA